MISVIVGSCFDGCGESDEFGESVKNIQVHKQRTIKTNMVLSKTFLMILIS